MKKNNFIKQFTSFLNKDDIIIFAGKSICNEPSIYTQSNILCIDDDCGYGMSIALGISMGTKKRVYLVCDDYYLLKDFGSVIHLGLSKIVNLFIVVLVTGHYPSVENMPTVAESIPNIKSLLFGTGFVVHDYTKHFKTQASAKLAKGLISSARGPMAIFMWPDKTKEDLLCTNKVYYNQITQITKLKEILKDESTALFTPPLVVVDKVEEK
jgi:hypothetical protein